MWICGLTKPAHLRGQVLSAMGCLAMSATAALAQQGGINVVAPTLPPRQAGASAPAPGYPSSPQPAQQTPQQVYPQQATPQQQYPQQTPQYNAPRGAQGSGARAPGAPASTLANRGGTAYPAQGAYGAYPQATPTEPAAAIVAPTRSTAAGNCRVEPAPDRQSMSLLGADALPRQHVPLGEFRVQQVIHSPDGRWAVAFTKLRGQPQFALMTLDLTRCEAQNTIDLPSAGDDARFDGDDAIVTLAGGERRVRLASTRVR